MAAKQNHSLAEGSEMSPLTWMEKEKKKKKTRTTTQNTYNIYYVFKLDVWIVSTDLGSVCVCGGGGGNHHLNKWHNPELYMV